MAGARVSNGFRTAQPNGTHSLAKAAQAIRSSAILLTTALAGAFPLALAQIQLRLASPGCRRNPRKTAPNSYRLLLAFPGEILT